MNEVWMTFGCSMVFENSWIMQSQWVSVVNISCIFASLNGIIPAGGLMNYDCYNGLEHKSVASTVHSIKFNPTILSWAMYSFQVEYTKFQWFITVMCFSYINKCHVGKDEAPTIHWTHRTLDRPLGSGPEGISWDPWSLLSQWLPVSQHVGWYLHRYRQ